MTVTPSKFGYDIDTDLIRHNVVGLPHTEAPNRWCDSGDQTYHKMFARVHVDVDPGETIVFWWDVDGPTNPVEITVTDTADDWDSTYSNEDRSWYCTHGTGVSSKPMDLPHHGILAEYNFFRISAASQYVNGIEVGIDHDNGWVSGEHNGDITDRTDPHICLAYNSASSWLIKACLLEHYTRILFCATWRIDSAMLNQR